MTNRSRAGPLIAVLLVATTVLAFGAAPAGAVPNLQVYIVGSTYDTATQTFTTEATTFDLQVLFAKGGQVTSLSGVKLATALPQGYDPVANGLAVTIGGVPVSFTNSGTPIMGDGSPLPTHGIYPTIYGIKTVGDLSVQPGTTVYDMQEVALGDPTPGSAPGQIVQYPVVVSATTLPSYLHFDAYDHYAFNDTIHAKFAPFSHDAQDNPVPEPGTLVLLTMGGLGLLGAGKQARRR